MYVHKKKGEVMITKANIRYFEVTSQNQHDFSIRLMNEKDRRNLCQSHVGLWNGSIGYIVKRFAFFPPKPPRYITVKTDKEDEDAILFLIKDKEKKKHYVEIKFKLIEYRFIKMINKFNEEFPLLLFIPPNYINVCIIDYIY